MIDEWNQQGFIPGPDETEEAFLQRVTFCQNLRHHLLQQAGTVLPFSKEEQEQQLLEEAWPLTQELYGFTPHWVPLFFNNFRLAPWHAGCAWIFQFDDQSPPAALLQLRKNFQRAAKVLGIYDRKEILAHELAHIGRMAYEEPQFEEMLAYQSSSSQWRRWLGPIFQSNRETLFFTFLLFIPLAAWIVFPLEQESVLMLFLLPLAGLFFGLGRLFYRHQTLKRCKKHLEELYHHPETARHLLYRLRDVEIRQFASLSSSKIREWMTHSLNQSFRWKFLQAVYPLPTLAPKESELA